ncbi:MAG: hypothetical protein LUB59_03675 [Candidatus Gastranaerophilales bacterium]|nr:hypothetical protein [Candidatus Gastranaerophilales bacterium]
MPVEWYVYSANRIKPDDSEEEKEKKRLNQRICAHKKPYFFGYNYQSLKREYDQCVAEMDAKLQNLYQKTLRELQNSDNLTPDEEKALSVCQRQLPLDCSPSTMNRICWAIERHFDKTELPSASEFDYSIYKSGCEYSAEDAASIKQVCAEYQKSIKLAQNEASGNANVEPIDKRQLLQCLQEKCESICPNSTELCEILLDLCYSDGASKGIVWELCGDDIVENLLRKTNYKITYPERVKSGGFWCCGAQFISKTITLDEEVCYFD